MEIEKIAGLTTKQSIFLIEYARTDMIKVTYRSQPNRTEQTEWRVT